MRITRVETHDLRVPLPKPITDSIHAVEKWGVPTCVVHTDEGLTGWGYTGTLSPGNDLICETIDRYYAPILIGKDPFNVKLIWDELHWSLLRWVGRAGITQMAHAAVDVALWDLMAKAAGKPLWQYLGGHKPERIKAYCTDGGWLNWSREDLVADCKRLVEEEGFPGVKIKIGKEDPREDYERTKAVRQALGDKPMLMVDCNQKWNLATAMVWGKRLEEFDLFWLEEPLNPDDIAGHRRLAEELNVPIALGEHVYTKFGFRDYIAAEAVEYVQVDATRVAGITEWLQVAGMAACYDLRICPHVGDMGQIHQHLTAATPNALLQEYIPWIRHCFVDPIVVEDGHYLVPQSPEASTEMKPEALEQYRVR
ncbi:MAG: mandelate racemase/muconate lactonizing enzyme family protein [Armatimonadetes bacterium]|nr:mandelate racemase/muconate lactonizing enzyme family protein [Armatimonadota bacterium]